MAKKKEHYGVYIIVGIVIILAVAFIYYSGGSFGQAVARPEKYERCIREAEQMKSKMLMSEMKGEKIPQKTFDKYERLLSECRSLQPPAPERQEMVCPPCKECPSCPTPTHIMSENERQTWTVKMPDGRMNEFDVELLVVSETSSEAKFKINGEITEPLNRGAVYNLNDGVFVITAIEGSQVEAAILPVTRFWKPSAR